MPAEESSSYPQRGPGRAGLTRLQLIQRGAAGAAVVGAGGLLVACGSDDDGGGGGGGGSTTSSVPKTDAEPKKGGTLRIGVIGGGNGDTLLPYKQVGPPDFARIANLYDPLVETTEEYEVVNALAEELEPSPDGKTWTIRVKDGIEFHDGKALNADDVIFTLERNTLKEFASPRLPWLKPSMIKKIDDRTVQLNLPEPRATVRFDLVDFGLSVMPSNLDTDKPIGTGPFKLESFTPGRESVYTRNENYWREVYVDELRIINFADDTAGVNALDSGQIDALNSIPYSQVPSLKSNDNVQVVGVHCGAWYPFCMRVDVEPFSDPNVRKAMRMLVDRQQLIDQALAGFGRVANDLYSPDDVHFNKDIPARERDVEQAKSLLSAAGVSKLTLDTSEVGSGVVQASEVFVEQAREAGLEITLRKSDPGTFYGDKYLTYAFSTDSWSSPPWFRQVQQIFRSNETHWAQEDRPGGISPEEQQWLDYYNEAAATVDDAKRTELVHQAQQIEYDHGGYIIWGYRDVISLYAKNIAGFFDAKTGHDLGNYKARLMFFTD